MSPNPTDRACLLWMDLEGEIFSPGMSLGRATREMIERDIWNGAYSGVCHAVYSYGSYANGGSYCRDITREVAESLWRMSLAGKSRPAASAIAFLEKFELELAEERFEPLLDAAALGASSAKPRKARRRRAKELTPEELRAQPQFKLPIPGGKSAAQGSEQGGQPSTRVEAGGEAEVKADVGMLSLKDTRPRAEIEGAWRRFDTKLRDMGVKLPAEAGEGGPPAMHPLRTAKG